jgi:putative peptide zinc metalloprotease protein
MEARYTALWQTDRVKAAIIQEDLRYAKEHLTRVRERVAELAIRSRTDGTFVAPRAEDLPGRFVKKGEELGQVVDLTTLTVRTVVSQTEIDLVRQRTRRVEVRLAERVAESLPAVLTRITPAATERLPSPALGSQGGGQVAVDPTDPHGVKGIQKLFHMDLELPARGGVVNVGGRAYLRFDHGVEPLAVQGYRKLRQLFLARFHV